MKGALIARVSRALIARKVAEGYRRWFRLRGTRIGVPPADRSGVGCLAPGNSPGYLARALLAVIRCARTVVPAVAVDVVGQASLHPLIIFRDR